jgi:glycosyltransferase involved in cell wall biosynthesis
MTRSSRTSRPPIALVIPYVDIFQSGVPFLAFSFGLPVIATDVGSLREDVTSETGLLCRPCDPDDLARAVTDFFRGELYGAATEAGARICRFAEEHHSWETVRERTKGVYAHLASHRSGRGGRAASAPHPQQASSKCQE